MERHQINMSYSLSNLFTALCFQAIHFKTTQMLVSYILISDCLILL